MQDRIQNDDPAFPPLLMPIAVSPPESAFDHACRSAAAGVIGASDLVWSRALDCAEIALVLEPEVVLSHALQMAPLAMVALGDCLGALMPPKTAITLHWPDVVAINGGAAGRLRLASSTASLESVPDWLAVGVVLRLKPEEISGEPGDRPEITSVEAEGGGELTRSLIQQSYAAHLLAWLDVWNHEGFEPVRSRWAALAEDGAKSLDDFAGLVTAGSGGGSARTTPLSAVIDLVSWRGEPVA